MTTHLNILGNIYRLWEILDIYNLLYYNVFCGRTLPLFHIYTCYNLPPIYHRLVLFHHYLPYTTFCSRTVQAAQCDLLVPLATHCQCQVEVEQKRKRKL